MYTTGRFTEIPGRSIIKTQKTYRCQVCAAKRYGSGPLTRIAQVRFLPHTVGPVVKRFKTPAFHAGSESSTLSGIIWPMVSFADSSKGKTPGSDPENGGSIPSTAAFPLDAREILC